jgi:hypothetical protein
MTQPDTSPTRIGVAGILGRWAAPGWYGPEPR